MLSLLIIYLFKPCKLDIESFSILLGTYCQSKQKVQNGKTMTKFKQVRKKFSPKRSLVQSSLSQATNQKQESQKQGATSNKSFYLSVKKKE